MRSSALHTVLDCKFLNRVAECWPPVASVSMALMSGVFRRMAQLKQLTFNDQQSSAVQPRSVAYDSFLFCSRRDGDNTGAAMNGCSTGIRV